MKDIYIDFSKGSPHWRIFENCHFDMVRLAAVSHIDKYLERYPNAAKQLQSEDMDVPGYLAVLYLDKYDADIPKDEIWEQVFSDFLTNWAPEYARDEWSFGGNLFPPADYETIIYSACGERKQMLAGILVFKDMLGISVEAEWVEKLFYWPYMVDLFNEMYSSDISENECWKKVFCSVVKDYQWDLLKKLV